MTSMGPPPMTPGYSLRVQLFAPNAHTASDPPVRCFRVVASPDATLHEFCQEAARIHAISYGQSISIKKCQDDQLFDVTQSDLIGPIFPNASTIRMIQASNVPSIRDSVPPTSALSYDPTHILGKRQRLESPILNGSGPPNSWKVNKRQRVFDIDPDQPIQSREYDSAMNETLQEDDVVPDSQENGSLAVVHGYPERQSVRLSTVPETPAVSPPLSPSLPTATNRIRPMSAFPSLHSPFHEPPIRLLVNESRAKSASYHISRLEARGISISTAATTPLDTDQQLERPSRNQSEDFPHGIAQNAKNENRSGNEDNIYGDIASDKESIPGLWRTRAALKIRNNSRASLPGPSQGTKLDTPPTGGRRHSSQLPLTPSSRTKKAIGAEEGQYNQANARVAAAKAAEQRRQAAEAQRIQEQEQAGRELKIEDEAEKERLEMEKADEMRAKELAAAAKAEQIRNEQEEKKAAVAMKKLEAERSQKERDEEAAPTQEKFLEAERFENEKKEEQAARERKTVLERKAAATVQKNLNEKRAKEELAAVAKAEKLRLQLEQEGKRAAMAAEKKEALEVKFSRTKAAALGKRKSSSPETEVLEPKPAVIKPQSATPFIPRGRSASRQSSIRSALKSSSPEFSRNLPQVRKGVGLADQCPLPIEKTKSVAFINDTDNSPKPLPSSTNSSKFNSPILPGAKVSVTSIPAPAGMTSCQVSTTPILPPNFARPIHPTGRASTSQASLRAISVTPVPPPLKIAESVIEPRKERRSIPVVEVPCFTPPRRSTRRVTAKVSAETASQQSSPSPTLPERKITVPTTSMGRIMARSPRASQLGSGNGGTNTNVELLERSKHVERQSVKTEIVNSSDDDSDDLYEGDKTHEEDHVQKPASEEFPSTKFAASAIASINATKPNTDSLTQASVDVEMEHHVEDNPIQGQVEDDEDCEMASRYSSPRESRSPVVFNRHDMSQKSIMSSLPPKSAQAARAASPNSIVSNNDVAERTVNFQEDDQDEEEGEEEEEDTEQSKEEGDESETESSCSSAENVEEDRASPDLPSHNSKDRHISFPPLRSQRTQPLSPSSRAQDEIDQRLTSSTHMAYAARTPSNSQPKHSPLPSLSGSAIKPTQKLYLLPTMRNGVSLLAMKSGIVGYRSRAAVPHVDRTWNVAAAMTKLREQEYLSEDEDSDSDRDSSESDNDEDIPAIAAPKPSQVKAGSDDSKNNDKEQSQALDLTAQPHSTATPSQQTKIGREKTASKHQRKKHQRKQEQRKKQQELSCKKASEDLRGKTAGRVISGYSFARPP